MTDLGNEGEDREPSHNDDLSAHVDPKILGLEEILPRTFEDVDGSTFSAYVFPVPKADATIIVRSSGEDWHARALSGDYDSSTGHKRDWFIMHIRQLTSPAHSWGRGYLDDEIGKTLKFMADDARRAHPIHPPSDPQTHTRRGRL